MTIIKYLFIITIAAIALYFLFQHFLLKSAPWKESDGLECDTNDNCTTHECRQQNNYWINEAIEQSNRKICNKAVECYSGDTKTTIFDEIELCQTEYEQSINQ